jgi:VWFA-related protein
LRTLAKALQHHLLDDMDVSIVDNSALVLPFTRDRDSLELAIRKLQNLNLSPCHGGPWVAAAQDRLLQMRSIPGKKFLLMFSDGVPDPQCVSRVLYVGSSPERLVASALDSNVAIYPIDPRGVVPVIPGGDASIDLGLGLGPMAITDAINENLSWGLTLLSLQRSTLLQVAAQTGGRSPAGNDLVRAIRDMREDSSYYDLGYYLPDLEADGRYHRIQVVLRRPNVQVLTKQGYFAPIPFAGLSRAGKRNWLYQALLADQPLGEIELISRNSAFLNPPSSETTIGIAVKARWWVPQDYASNRRWTMLVAVLQDEHGNVVDRLDTQNFWHARDDSPPEGGYAPQNATYNLLLRLKPGRYELKMAVADLYAALAGSTHAFFQVPEQPAKLPAASSLVLSDTWVTSESAAERGDSKENPIADVNPLGTARGLDPLRVDDRRLQPSVDRVFTRDSMVTMFARFYPASPDRFPEDWRISAILRDSAGKVLTNEPVTEAKPSSPAAPGIHIVHAFDLSKLPLHDGRYTAEFEFAHPDRKQPLRISGQFIVETAADRRSPTSIN